MTDSRDIAVPLQALLANLDQQGRQHLGEVQADLRQTTDLLAAAIDKLGTSFIGIHEAMTAQQALLATVMPTQATDGAAAAHDRLCVLQARSRLHADAAITALQFEDMTTQLIGRIAGHVESLQAVIGSLGAAALGELGVDGATGPADVVGLLAALNRVLDEHAAAPAAAKKTVAQTHMDSGDIELF